MLHNKLFLTGIAVPVVNATHDIRGVLFCVFGLFGFATQDSIVKYVSAHYPVLEVLTLRTLVVLVVLTVIAIAWQGRRLLRPRKLTTLLIRGVFAFVAFTLYYLALSRMQIADAATIYMTAPFFVTALSIPLLGEKVGLHRWAAMLTGFSAAVYMINPGNSVFQSIAVLPLLSAIAYAFIPIINRKVGLSEHALTMALYNIVGYSCCCVVAAIVIHYLDITVDPSSPFSNLFVTWSLPSLHHFLLMAVSGLIFIAALLSLTQAYRILPVSIVAPFEYSYILWATLIGFVVFAEVPGKRTVVGGVLIVLAGTYITLRERRLNSQTGGS